MRALAFLVGALALSAARRRSAPARWREEGMHRIAIAVPEIGQPVQLPPVSTPAVAAGALALGALAVGALAIGALAIGRLEIRQARLREVVIDDLIVRRFRVVDGPAPGGKD